MSDITPTTRLLHEHRHSRVWGYVRVSEKKQKDGQSLDAQKADIVAYCTEHKLEAPHFVEEIGSAEHPMFAISLPGMPDTVQETQPRPLLLLLIGHLREITGSHLVFWKLDRFSRHQHEQEFLCGMLHQAKVTLHSCQPGERHLIDGSASKDPIRILIRNVMGAFAQYERSMIQLRMQTGLTFKAAKGGFTGGIEPFGYRVHNKELVIEPFEAEMVRYIFKLRHEYGYSYQSIADTITANKNPADAQRYDRQKITRIIQNEAMYRGTYTDCFGSPHPRPDLKILPDKEYSHG